MENSKNVENSAGRLPGRRDRYEAASPANWTGRTGGEAAAPQYWHQAVHCLNWAETALPALSKSELGIVFLGYAVDEGVRRNQGRPGAAAGPAAIRRQLGRLSWHLGAGTHLVDAGDLSCPDGELEAVQLQLAAAIRTGLAAGYFPIVLGGGHDIAYGHGRGVMDYCARAQPGSRIGIVNFDAHFDLRRPVEGANSGTPFYQLMEETTTEGQLHYCVVGIQAAANPPELFATAERFGVEVISAEAVHLDSRQHLRDQLLRFAASRDYLYVTIDLDGFAAAYAPGVSAPSPMGFAPPVICELLAALFTTGKVISMDIAELNPHFDLDDRTARLAGRLVYAAVEAWRLRG